MKAIILAAGTASRLRPLTLHTPKCLLKVGERTLLQRSMDAIIRAGVREFVIVTGYLHEKIENFVQETYGNSISVCFIHNKDYETTNNIYSLWLARPEAEGEEVLLLDSDLLYDPQIITELLDCPDDNVLALIRHDLGPEEMKVVGDGNGRIEAICKTCDPQTAAGESLGIEKMGKTYVSALKAELKDMMTDEGLRNVFYEKAFEQLIAKGYSFTVKDVTEFRSMELDTVGDFETAGRLFE